MWRRSKQTTQLEVIDGLSVILLGVVPRAGLAAAETAADRALSHSYNMIAHKHSNTWYLDVQAVLRSTTTS